MRIIEPGYEIITEISEGGEKELKFLEKVARVCYKSEGLITEDTTSAEDLIKKLLARNHEAMLEHFSITIKFTCDRGVSHEIVRHRIASFAQESTRYCNYTKDKHGNEITVISPCFFEEGTDAYDEWKNAMEKAEDAYFTLVNDEKRSPQEARSVLPNSLKTEIVMTANLREWRHFFTLRTAEAAHPQMREITRPLLDEIKTKIPLIFDDINY